MRGDRDAIDPTAPGPPTWSAGGVLFRRTHGRVEVLLGEQTDWNTRARTVRLPKGHIDAGESLEAAALREVREETGRHARVLERLCESRYAYENLATGELVAKGVVFFLMEDAGDASEHRDDELEALAWTPIDEAIARLTFDNERDAVRAAARRIAARASDS